MVRSHLTIVLRSLAALLVPAAVLAYGAAKAQAPQPDAGVLIVDANVVDTLDGSVRRDVSILIEGTRISRIGPRLAPSALHPGIRTIALPGKYVIPGLWDMSVHSMIHERDPEWFFPLLIAHGVTGIRDMGSLAPLERMVGLRREVRAGRAPGPRMILAGAAADLLMRLRAPALTGDIDPAAAAGVVQLLKSQGADFISVSPFVPRHWYQTLSQAAARQRMPVAGDVPESMTVAEVAMSGQRSIENIDRIVIGCADAESAIRDVKEELLRAMPLKVQPDLLQALTPTLEETLQVIATFDVERCTQLIKTMAAYRVAVVPMLVLDEGLRARFNRVDHPRLAQLPAIVRQAWLTIGVEPPLASTADAALAAQYQRAVRAIVRAFVAAGVPVLAGTHAGAITPFIIPGASLHDELIQLVEAGLSPLEALQTATLAPAGFLDQAANLGRIAEGQLADLVVLDANPIEAIENVRKVHAVVVDGRVYGRIELDALLERAAAHER